MSVNSKLLAVIVIFALLLSGCGGNEKKKHKKISAKTPMEKNLEQFVPFVLKADISNCTESEKLLVPIFIEVAKIMDDLFWQQTYGDRDALLAELTDEKDQKYAMINYGPWERMNGDYPFIRKYGRKPIGSNFYPADITKREFEDFDDPLKTNPYTLIRRTPSKSLTVIQYNQAYKNQLSKAAELLTQAVEIADNKSMKKYLTALSSDLLNDDYTASTIAWLELKDNNIDFVCGPIEVYEDKFMGCKTAYTAMIFIKDIEWTEKIDKYTKLVPILEKEIPLDEKYKKPIKDDSRAQLCVYELIYAAGDANAEAKPVAISLPNDERISLEKGSRNMQLKNMVKAKFETILMPIANILVDESQKANVTFDAFFNNIMFQKLSNLIGVKDFIEGKSDLKETLKEKYCVLEETKADMLSIYMTSKLYELGEIKESEVMDSYVTYMASIFRSVRFGCTNVHGKSNMLIFNFFKEFGAFVRNEATGTYKVDREKLEQASDLLLKKILVLQGNRDYKGVAALLKQKGNIKLQLMQDLDKLTTANIPVDIILDQSKVI
ncbi:MAG: Zn-dependent hydrolase [Bacteroidetes bacterium]|nr:Zn-dependent hydrolase [Bacteroidota bacterium]MBU1718340.1 Zn-dependent hydrolase [Bacteroidota bacterium]